MMHLPLSKLPLAPIVESSTNHTGVGTMTTHSRSWPETPAAVTSLTTSPPFDRASQREARKRGELRRSGDVLAATSPGKEQGTAASRALHPRIANIMRLDPLARRRRWCCDPPFLVSRDVATTVL
jgi:hypothetical protein